MKTITPLRYPGGKTSLAPVMSAVMDANGLTSPLIAEPYAGGAGASLSLLFSERVSSILINDFDYRIFSFWWSVLNETDRFLEKVRKISLSIREWKNQRAIYRNARKHKRFDVGFASFYLNRTNRSGILINGGPIGGFAQRSEWGLDARFTRPALADRIERIAAYRDRIETSNLDALTFVHSVTKKYSNKELFLYLDPPYYEKGRELYFSYYGHEDHVAVGKGLRLSRHLNWIVTYDDVPAIREIYKNCQIIPYKLRYTAQVRRYAAELFIAPKKLVVPSRLLRSI